MLPGGVERHLGPPSVPGVAGGLAIGSLGVLDDINRGVITSDGGGVGGGIAALRGGGGGGLTLGGEVVIEAVETLGFGAVKVEPPVADEVVLVEDGSVGAEEAVLGKASSTISGTDVENLALSLWVSVISSINLTIARKSGLWNLGIDGVIFSGDSRNSFL